MARGIIFSIEEFAINDGPGIRTTVFLKGCPLRCAWCHNPEGLLRTPQTMETIDGPRICGTEIEAAELAEQLRGNKDIFTMNGGGVTFTGGEPTYQPAFLLEMLERLSDIHTAVETSGFCSEDIFARMLELTDYVLFDIKVVDPAAHRRFTGVDNSLILKNLQMLCKSGREFVARIPLIPGVNDSPENMEATANLLNGAKGLRRVELLRYHKTAGAKYARLGMKYDPPFDTEAEPAVYDFFQNTIVL